MVATICEHSPYSWDRSQKKIKIVAYQGHTRLSWEVAGCYTEDTASIYHKSAIIQLTRLQSLCIRIPLLPRSCLMTRKPPEYTDAYKQANAPTYRAFGNDNKLER